VAIVVISSFCIIVSGFLIYRVSKPNEMKAFWKMSGRDVFRKAVKTLGNCAQEIVDRNDKSVNDTDLVVTYQTNLRIIDALRERRNVVCNKIRVIIDKYGNTSAPSCVIVIGSLIGRSIILRRSKLAPISLGPRSTWGATIWKFSDIHAKRQSPLNVYFEGNTSRCIFDLDRGIRITNNIRFYCWVS
jgi:3-oxoacyl-[acyl-carrier-protein] synthase III